MTEPDQQPDTIFGTWWLPSTPEHKVGGEMKIGAYGERRLQLSGSIHVPPPGETFTIGPHEEPLIYGMSQKGRRYSLIEARYRHGSFNPTTHGTFSETWEFDYHASGTHHIEPTTAVKGIDVTISTLPVWCFDEDSLAMMMGSGGGGVTPPEPLTYSTSVREAIVTFYDAWSTSMVRALCSIEHTPFLQIEVNTTIEKVYDDWVWPLQQLFCFLTLEYASVSDLRVTTNNSEAVNLMPHIVAPVDPSRQPELSRMFASKAALDHLGINLPTLLRDWMLLADGQHYLLEIINTLSVRRYFYEDSLLVFLFRTLELYHAHNLGGTPISKAEYKRRTKEILKITRSDLHPWLKGIFNSQNRKSQRVKLAELLERCHGVGDVIVERFPDFVNQTVKQRNRTAHGTELSTTDQAQSSKVCRYLEWMTYRLILAELNISNETADKMVINNWRSPFR